MNWGYLSSTGWGRSELAADLYDEILFDGATFADLDKRDGPVIAVSATDLATGSRIMFTTSNFDAMCTDLGAFRLSRAAAASSAVPVVLSPLTINNYGGSCGKMLPLWFTPFINTPNPPRPAARTLERINELNNLMNGGDPYLHLVDGGISDNLGLRGGVEVFNWMEALREGGHTTPLDHVNQIIMMVVNSMSIPKNDWNKSEDPPGTIPILIKAAGVPIDRYSSEQIEHLRDIEARWSMMRSIRDLPAVKRIKPKDSNDALNAIRKVPNARLYVVNVSFAGVPDAEERDYLNELPTSFVLSDEAVDRLRIAGGTALLNSPDFQQLLSDSKARIIETSTKPAVISQ
jgi:NTE family protein